MRAVPFVVGRTRSRFAQGILLAGTFLLASASGPPARAVVPVANSDDQLAAHPIIVVARWNKARIWRHDLVEGNTGIESETHTDLVVEKVIQGNIQPGTHPVILGFQVGWPDDDGGPLMSYSSTMMTGDVKQVADANLWFLQPTRSWDEKDPKTYLLAGTFRNAQPLVLEPYFRALAAEQPLQEVPKLLASDKPLVLRRVLEYVAGDATPWPYDWPVFPYYPAIERVRPPPAASTAAAVEKLFAHKQPEVRRLAAAVLVEIAGGESVAAVRKLLADDDAEVRAIAAGTLARYESVDGASEIPRALRGLDNPYVASRVIARLAAWKSPHAEPALIEFLETGGFIYYRDADPSAPALEAQAALRKRTGFAFPFDVAAARKAWDEARTVDDPKLRARRLAELLPWEPEPLEGKLVLQGKTARLTVTNRSKQPVSVAVIPDQVMCRWSKPNPWQWSYDGRNRTVDDFQTLAPGKSLRIRSYGPMFREQLDHPRNGETGKLSLRFLDNGKRLGLSAWMGPVEVTVDDQR